MNFELVDAIGAVSLPGYRPVFTEQILLFERKN